MHRAYCFMRLVNARNCRRESANTSPVGAGVETAIACDLADRFRSLKARGERDLLSCSTIMQDVIIGFGALFGRPLGATIETEIEEVLLPAYKRRALVLAVAELISNALLHAFPARRAGAIEVELTAKVAMSARLRVADSGVGFIGASPNLDCGVAASLANLLEADLSYNRKDGWTIAEIVFPLSGS
jgi:two-component sensor histidine kinase